MNYMWLLLLLPLAATCGWYTGMINASRVRYRKSNGRFARDYFVGLNFLLNEQPDKAVDVFTRLVEVDSETIETHLALGNLFRRRGEVGRAIRIHQNIIARPQLTKGERQQALLALGHDYLRAGVLDRAERLFQEVALTGEYTSRAQRLLIDIYQQQKNWQKAIETAQQLSAQTKESVATPLAHYYCEMATIALQESRLADVRQHIKLALKSDPKCVRANLILGEMEQKLDQYKSAIDYYEQIRAQDPDYFIEALTPLIYCYEQMNDLNGLNAYLQETLQFYPRISVSLAIADIIQKTQTKSAAANFITQQLRQRPSLKGLQYLIGLQLAETANSSKENLLILQDLINNLLRNKPIYCCTHCGFKSKILIWLCPSCKQWSTVKLIQGAEGD